MNSNLWFLVEDADIAFKFGELLLADDRLGVDNTAEFGDAQANLATPPDTVSRHDIRLPDGFLAPRLALPRDRLFAPDFFMFGSLRFASRKFREAVAQPEDVVQFSSVDLVSGHESAQQKDYRLMRVLARQHAMDLDRSECRIVDIVNRVTGEKRKWPESIRRFRLNADLKPETEIFRMDELPTEILVTDALAVRVLRAGCTGMEFSATDNLRAGMRVERYRTVDGVAERRADFLD